MVRTKLSSAAGSHPGLVRKNNEDRVYCDTERGVFLVIDGMGGQAAGEEAARLAENRIRRRLERQTGTPEERIREAITVANNEIYETARRRPEWFGMACVLTAALIEDGVATIGHVGDSRLYKIRAGAIRKITRDHSPVGEREDAGEIGEVEAMRHPRRNEVYRDVGSEEHSPDDPEFIEIWRVPVEPDCALVLCSDGLSDQVPASDILRIVERNALRLDRAVAQLIEAANLAGGKDNVSVIIVRGEEFTPVLPDEPEPRGRFLFSRPAFFLYGLLLAAAAFAAWSMRQPKAPVVPAAPEGPRTLTVGPGSSFTSIADALSRALAGDTIEVVGGEYREPVTLKEGITLRSRVPREAILRAAAADAAPGIGIYSDGVRNARVVGFRILADAKMPLAAGIVLVNSSVEIEDVEISGARNGIEIRGDSSPAIRACHIHDNHGAGIAIVGSGAPWLSHNVLGGNGRGVTAEPGTRPTLVRNVFLRNSVEPFALPQIPRQTVLEFNYFPREPARGGKR